MLKAVDIHKKYGDLEVLKGIDLEIAKNEIVSVVGASGAGKSTLLHILGTLDMPDRGAVLFNDQAIAGMKPKALASFRNSSIGFVFQFHNLLPEFTTLENICMPGYIADSDRKTLETKATELMKLLGIAARTDHKPSQLSGGEQQRAAVARALINDPLLVFADEPSGNLDSKNAAELHDLFFQLRSELDQTFIIVTHNEVLADKADRKLEIKDGKMLN